MRVFKNRAFTRFALKNKISDQELCQALFRAARGLVDADLGGGVIKQRIAREGAGKSSGFRSLIMFRNNDRAIFVHGFAKKDVDNIDARELRALKKLAKIMFAYSEAEMIIMVRSGALLEVNCHGKTVS